MSSQPTWEEVTVTDDEIASMEVSRACGLQITITGESFDFYRKEIAAKHPEAHYADVVVEHKGNRVEFTYEEFLERVGLNK